MTSIREKWLRFGCFITGYNYNIVRDCSELSMKRVIRFTSSLLIICLLWAFIGIAFTARYLQGTWYSCLAGMLIMVFIVVQIERQIILARKKNPLLGLFRVTLAVAMAMIGTVIIDQFIFKDDIDKRKLMSMDEEVNRIFPGRSEELKRQISEIDHSINLKELERKAINDDVMRSPFLNTYERVTQRDSAGREQITIIKKNVLNPKTGLLDPLDKTIQGLREEKHKKDSILLTLRPAIEAELKQNVGFLDELEVMFDLLSESGVSLTAWLIWFFFLFALELLILVSKAGDHDTDYDKRLEEQMALHIRKIELLKEKSLQIEISHP